MARFFDGLMGVADQIQKGRALGAFLGRKCRVVAGQQDGKVQDVIFK